MKKSAAIAITTALGFAFTQAAFGQASDDKLGKVHFETTCKPEAQKQFDRAMLYQHSFWYRASKLAFEDTLKADPEGAAAIAKARSASTKAERERDYIDALAAMYTDFEKMPHLARSQAYAKAMEQVAKRYPNDDEAQIHYALALNTSASPQDKTYANQLKGAAILEPIFARQPRHPGVAHYLIHLYDYPPIAEKGLNAARAYARIAPDAAHAQHMPSHIFTRVGYWQESIDSNAVSQRGDRKSVG